MEVIEDVMADIEAGGGAQLSEQQHAVVAKALRRLEKKLKKSQNAKNKLGNTPKTPTALEQEEKQLEKGKEKFLPKKLWPMKSASLDTTFADQYSKALDDIHKVGSKPAEFITSFTGLLQLEGQLANFLSAIAEGTFANEDVRKMVANGLKSYITAYIGKTIVNKEGELLKEVAKNDMPGYATAILQKVADQIAVPRIPPNVKKAAVPAVPGVPKVPKKSIVTKFKNIVTKNVDKVKGKLAEHRADKTAKKADEASKKPGAKDASAKKATADQAHAAAATAKTEADKLHASPEAAAAHNAAAAAQAKVGEHKEGTPEHAAAVAHAASLKTEADNKHPLSAEAVAAHANADALAATAKQAATDAATAAAHPEAVEAAKAAAAAEKAAALTPAAVAAKAAETKAAEEAALAANKPVGAVAGTEQPNAAAAAAPAGTEQPNAAAAAAPAGTEQPNVAAAATPAVTSVKTGEKPGRLQKIKQLFIKAAPQTKAEKTAAREKAAETGPAKASERIKQYLAKKKVVTEKKAAADAKPAADDKAAALGKAAVNPMDATALQKQAANLKKVNPEDVNKIQKDLKAAAESPATAKNAADVQALVRKEELKNKLPDDKTFIKMQHNKEDIKANEGKGLLLDQKRRALDTKLKELKEKPASAETIKELKAHGKEIALHDKEVAKHEKETKKLEKRSTELEQRLQPTTATAKTKAFFRPVGRTVKNTGKAISKFGSRIKKAFTRKVKTDEEKLANETSDLARKLELQNKFGAEEAKIKAQHAVEDASKAQLKTADLSAKGADLKRDYDLMKQNKDIPLAQLQEQQKKIEKHKEEEATHLQDLKNLNARAQRKEAEHKQIEREEKYLGRKTDNVKTLALKAKRSYRNLKTSASKGLSSAYDATKEGVSEAAASTKEAVANAYGRAKGNVSEAATATGLAAKDAAAVTGKAATDAGVALKSAASATGKAAVATGTAAAGLATGAAIAAAGVPLAAAATPFKAAADLMAASRLNKTNKGVDPMSLANALAIAHNLTSEVMKDALLKYAYINNQNDEVKEKALKKLKREAAEKQAIFDEKKRRVEASNEELIKLDRKKENLQIQLAKLQKLPDAERDEGEVKSVKQRIAMTEVEIENIQNLMADLNSQIKKETHNYKVVTAEMVAVENALKPETPKKGGKTRKRARRARKAKSKARPRRAATRQRRAGTKKGRTRFTSEDCFL